MTREKRRLLRQIGVVRRGVPLVGRPLRVIVADGWALVRLPLALLLILGGLLSFLPLLGLWMLPLGLLLLAVDVPPIQPAISAAFIRGRRRLSTWALARGWRRRRTGRRGGPPR